MAYVPSYRKGDWLGICDRCGFKYKASQLARTWDNLYVCRECWEPRHVQDFLRGIPDDQSVPWTRPEGPDTSATFVNIGSINPMTGGSESLADTDDYIEPTNVGIVYRQTGQRYNTVSGAFETIPVAGTSDHVGENLWQSEGYPVHYDTSNSLPASGSPTSLAINGGRTYYVRFSAYTDVDDGTNSAWMVTDASGLTLGSDSLSATNQYFWREFHTSTADRYLNIYGSTNTNVRGVTVVGQVVPFLLDDRMSDELFAFILDESSDPITDGTA